MMKKFERKFSKKFHFVWKFLGVAAAELAKCTRLKSVNLSHCKKISDASVAELAKCAQLKSVICAGATRSPTRAWRSWPIKLVG